MCSPAALVRILADRAMIKAGDIPFDTGALTVNKVCGSGLKAVMLLTQAIQTGDADMGVAGRHGVHEPGPLLP